MERLSDLLSNFNSLDKLKRLFWEELNYDRVNDPVRVRDWDYDIAELPIIFAEGGSQEMGGFKVLYTKLKGDELRVMHERTIITQLLHDFPYALFVFSNEKEDTWHFVNVKIAVTRDSDDNRKPQKRRLFRRLTIAPPYNHLHTAIDRITMLDLERVSGRDLFGLSPLAIQQQHDTAFDVEAVTKEFFREYRRVFENAERSISGIEDEEAKRLFTQKLFNRLMFIIFLEKKGWLTFNNSQDYVLSLWKDYRDKHEQGIDHNFYNDRLKMLFFTGLNNPKEVDIMGAGASRNLQERIGDVPYLNGGLFERSEYDEEDSTVVVPDDALRIAINDIFYRFNFTVIESTPLDVEVAVDPEMLGKIFEELVTGRHESGSYYTPKPVVSFMGREALKGYLQTACPDETPEAIARFVDDQQPDDIRDPEKVLEALKTVTICDPACGSGAYLVGMLHELVDLRLALFRRSKDIDAITGYQRKLEIIQNNIYGVDIDPFAVNIARLRLWLSLIVEFEGQSPLPLPNLDFKIEVGDSITGNDPSSGVEVDMFRRNLVSEFNSLKEDYMRSHGDDKKRIAIEIDGFRNKILDWSKGDDRLYDGFDWAIEFAEVFINGGFDIVLANPPYIRQELLRDIKPALRKIYGNRYSGLADLYVYFYYRGIQLLRKNGMLAYISSNKWLVAGYGESLRDFLATKTQVQSVINFGDLPLFTATAYPIVITLQKKSPTNNNHFKALQLESLETVNKILDEFKLKAWNQPQSSVNKDSWSLMRPEILSLLEKIQHQGETLEKYVKGEAHYGVKTGLNKAFLIDQDTRNHILEKDPNSQEIIKPYYRGRDIKRWRSEWDNLYMIFTRRGIDIEQYPGVRDHLAQFKKLLMPGTKEGRKPGNYEWYEVQDNVAYFAEFEKPKIIYQAFQVKPVFAMDTEGFYVNNSVWAISVEDYYLLALLNSPVGWFQISHTCSALQNGYQLIWNYFKNIIIALANEDLKKEIVSLTRDLVSLKQQDQDVTDLEEQINELVYKAYNLNPGEIQLITDQPLLVQNIRDNYPDKWLVIDVDARDSETDLPVSGFLLGVFDNEDAAWDVAEQFTGRSLYVFFNDAELLKQDES